MDFLNQGIPLGRWFRINVVLSWTFIIYAFYQFNGTNDVRWTTIALLATFGSVLLHEFGHCFGSRMMKGEADHILLWPLGGLAFVNPPLTPTAHLVTVAAGPAVNLVLWGVFWAVHRYLVLPNLLQFDLNSALFQNLWDFVHAMIWANRTQFLFNVLMPVFPMDGGRIWQCILWYILGYQKSLLIAGMTGTVGGVAFVVLGFGLITIHIPWVDITLGQEPSLLLLLMGVFFAMQSFAVYQHAQHMGTWRKR